MFAHRARAVVRAVKALVAYNMAAWIQNVRCSDAATKKTRLTFSLEKMDENFAPPEFYRVVRHIVGELAKQRLVLAVGTLMSAQNGYCPFAEGCQLIR